VEQNGRQQNGADRETRHYCRGRHATNCRDTDWGILGFVRECGRGTLSFDIEKLTIVFYLIGDIPLCYINTVLSLSMNRNNKYNKITILSW